MLEFKIETNAARVAASLGEAPKRISARVVEKLRTTVSATLIGYAAKEKLSGQVLEVRSGTLRRSLFYKVLASGLDAVLVFGADAKKAIYARVQEYGGVIRPTHSQNLAIPLDVARTAKGVARMSAREFIQNPGALGFERAFVNRKRTAIMGSKADGSFEPVFALKKEVKVPERSYIRSTVEDKRSWILEELQRAAAAGVNDER